MQPYLNLVILGISLLISIYIKKRLQSDKKKKKSGCFLLGYIFIAYTVLCYIPIMALGQPVKALYQKITMDKYQAKIVAIETYKKKRRGKSPASIQEITVKFKPKTSIDSIAKEVSIKSDMPPNTKNPYEIRYSPRSSVAISNSETNPNLLLIVIGLIPLYFVVFGIYYALGLKLPKWLPDFRKLMDKY